MAGTCFRVLRKGFLLRVPLSLAALSTLALVAISLSAHSAGNLFDSEHAALPFFRGLQRRRTEGRSVATEPCCSTAHCILTDADAKTADSGASSRLPVGRRLQIGFVTYATGPYNAFLPGLWESLRSRAFVGHDVHLFVFTDRAGDAGFLDDARVHKRQQSRLGWPFDSLARHFLFLSAREWFEAEAMDYLISVDSDSVLEGTLTEGVLGERIGAIQAWFYGHDKSYWTLDRRLTVGGVPYSSGYTIDEQATCYFTGNLFGGSVRGFMQLLQEIVDLARKDLDAYPRRVALWHDETYLNAALFTNPPSVIWGAHFMYPEPPADEWLYLRDETALGHEKARRLWSGPSLRERPFATLRKFLNLGVRKHATKSLTEFQPLSGVLPSIMSSSGLSGLFPIAIPQAQLADMITFLVRIVSGTVLSESLLARSMIKWCAGACCSILLPDGSTSASLPDCRTRARPAYAVVISSDAALSLRSPPLADLETANALSSMVYVLESSGGAAAPLDNGEQRRGFDAVWGCISALGDPGASETARTMQLTDAFCREGAATSLAYDSFEAACGEIANFEAAAIRTPWLTQWQNFDFKIATRFGFCSLRG